MNEAQKEKCKAIFEHYGIIKQKRQLIEECAELIQAITKLERAGEAGDSVEIYKATLNLREEIADVEIMLEQIKGAPEVEIDCTWSFQKIIDYKLDRQLGRIQEEKR